jgi:hypothetical protein
MRKSGFKLALLANDEQENKHSSNTRLDNCRNELIQLDSAFSALLEADVLPDRKNTNLNTSANKIAKPQL